MLYQVQSSGNTLGIAGCVIHLMFKCDILFCFSQFYLTPFLINLYADIFLLNSDITLRERQFLYPKFSISILIIQLPWVKVIDRGKVRVWSGGATPPLSRLDLF